MPPGAIPFPFGMCRICKDKATGVHYGVTTCEGCKGFFKRSITRGDKYKCFFGGDCDLTPRNRNRCKSCRFRKCLDAGMSVEAVRMGRIPKMEKEKALEVFHQGGSDFKNLEIEVEMTGTGSYDFKINSKEGSKKSSPQTGSQITEPGGVIQQENTWNQTGISSMFELDSQKLQNKGQKHSLEESRSVTDYTGQPLMKTFSRMQSDFNLYPTHPLPSDPVQFCSGKLSSNRSSTISLHVQPHSDENRFACFSQEDNSGSLSNNYDFGQSNCEYFKVPFANFKNDVERNIQEPYNRRLHSNDSTLKSDSEYHRSFHLSNTQSSFGGQEIGSYSRDIDSELIPWSSNKESVLHTMSRAAEPQSVDQFNSHQGFNPPQKQSVAKTQIQQNGRPGFEENFRQFGAQQSCIGQTQMKQHNVMPSATHTGKSQEQCFDFTSSNFSAREEIAFSYEMKPDHIVGDAPSQGSAKSSDENTLDLTDIDHYLEEKNSGNQIAVPDITETGNKKHCEMESSSSVDQCDSKSFENLRCSSPGSVISREGSNSSQRSGYSPAIIQILLDQVLDSDQGSTLKENLKKKLDQSKTDSNILHRVLNLINNAAEKRKKISDTEAGDSSSRLDNLPEDRLESMNRFLSDINNCFDKIEAPLLKKKRCIEEMELKESFDNLDVQKPVNLEVKRYDDTCDNASKMPDAFMPELNGDTQIPPEGNLSSQRVPFHSQNMTDIENIEVSSHDILMNHSNQTVSQNIAQHPTAKMPLSVSQIRPEAAQRTSQLTSSSQNFHSIPHHENIQYNPQNISANHNFHSNPQHMSTNESIQYNPQNISANQNFHSNPQHMSTNENIQYNPQNISANHNFHSNPQHMSTNESIQYNSQNISANQNFRSNAQHVSHNENMRYNPQNVLANQNEQYVSMRSLHTVSAFEKPEVSDNFVTSTDTREFVEHEENVEEMLQTIDCMNLAMKILNRFKPEHREKIRLYKQGQLHLRTLTDSDEDCAEIYEKLMQGIPGLNDRILGFCECVPGFAKLSKEDKEKLVKRSYYDMWTLSYAEYFQNGRSFWILPTGEIYSAEAMRKILNDEMVDTIMKFADSYNRLELSDLETALFSAIRLTSTTGTEIEDEAKVEVEKLHSHLLDTLSFEMKRNHRGNHTRLLTDMFQLVPLIEAINRIQGEIIANFSVNRFKKKAANTGDKDQRSGEPVKPVVVP